jgi:hypothetical protein
VAQAEIPGEGGEISTSLPSWMCLFKHENSQPAVTLRRRSLQVGGRVDVGLRASGFGRRRLSAEDVSKVSCWRPRGNREKLRTQAMRIVDISIDDTCRHIDDIRIVDMTAWPAMVPRGQLLQELMAGGKEDVVQSEHVCASYAIYNYK